MMHPGNYIKTGLLSILLSQAAHIPITNKLKLQANKFYCKVSVHNAITL